MEQTPAHEHHNPDLLRLIPKTSGRLIEVGCSAGALAREFKKINPACHYLGLDIEEGYAALARRYCDEVQIANIEDMDDAFFDSHRACDCWIFGDALEHLRDPWSVLKKIRRVMPAGGSVAACIPNAQHWSLQARLSVGALRYEESGLMDRTHLRWFTRQTLAEMFSAAGFAIAEGIPRIFNEPGRDKFLPAIGEMARLCGADPRLAMRDALPLQYVVRAIPAG